MPQTTEHRKTAGLLYEAKDDAKELREGLYQTNDVGGGGRAGGGAPHGAGGVICLVCGRDWVCFAWVAWGACAWSHG